MSDLRYFVERKTEMGWEPAGLGTPFPTEEHARIWVDQHGWEGERFRVIQLLADVIIPPLTRKVG